MAEVACYRLERTLMGCANPPSKPSKGVGAPHQCSRVKKKRSGWGEFVTCFSFIHISYYCCILYFAKKNVAVGTLHLHHEQAPKRNATLHTNPVPIPLFLFVHAPPFSPALNPRSICPVLQQVPRNDCTHSYAITLKPHLGIDCKYFE